MNTLPAFPFTTYIIAAFAVAILIAIAGFIYLILKKEKEFQEKEHDTLQNYERIIGEASEQARTIVSNASDMSVDLYKNAGNTSDAISEHLNLVLQEVAKKNIDILEHTSATFLTRYNESLLQIQEASKKQLQQSIETIQKDLNEKLAEYTASLTAKMVGTQGIDAKTQEVLQAAQQEIERYKTQQYASIDASMRAVIMKTYEDILGKSITLSLHEDLIVAALEKAKKEGVFGV